MSPVSKGFPCSRTERFAKPASVSWIRQEGYVVLDTPTCRFSSFNHRLELDHPPTSETLTGWFDRWRHHHGGKDIGYIYLTFEQGTEWVSFPLPDGVSSDPLTCLVLESPMPERPLPGGYEFRLLKNDHDWSALEGLTDVVNGGHTEDDKAYWSWYHGGLRERTTRDQGAWAGVWHEGLLVGAAGLFWDAREARFQDVQTHPDHRKRGVCSALLRGLVALWEARAGDAMGSVMIAATTHSDIERLYRGLGFAPCSWFYTLGTAP